MKRMFKFRLPKIKLPSKKFWFGKKFLISIALIAVVIVGGVFAVNGMKKDSLYKTALANVAEARYYMKSAANDNMSVQFFTGMREENYAQNGKADKTTPFAIINVTSKNAGLKEFNQIEGTIKIGGEQTPITLVQNPYDPQNFATDLARIVDADKSVEVTLFIGDTNHPTFTLQNTMGANAITWKEAMQIATEKVASKLKDGGKFEVYVKIVDNMAKDGGAFWYVQFITADGKTHFCVIAPDGSVIG